MKLCCVGRAWRAVLGAGVAVRVLTVGWAAAGTLSGRVTGPDGSTPIDDLRVTAWRKTSGGWLGLDTRTAANGSYAFVGLSDGIYHIEFNRYGDERFAAQCARELDSVG